MERARHPPQRCAIHADGYAQSAILADGPAIEKALRDLAVFAGMQVFGASSHPIDASVDSGPGWSVFVGITTSHIAAHTWPEKGFLMLDLVSCKEFDHDLLIARIEFLFDVQTWHRLIRVPPTQVPLRACV